MAGKYILGVDIGTSAVKVLVATKHNGRINVLGSGTVPGAGFAKGAVTDAGALAAAVREAVDCAVMVAEAPLGPVQLGIGGIDLTSQNGLGSVAPSAGMATGADIERACRAAAAVTVPDSHRILHILPIGFWLDGQTLAEPPLGKSGKRLEVEAHIVSMPASRADELTAALADKGITVAAILANAVVGGTDAAGTDSCLVIDIGAGLADLSLHSGGKIVFTASLPLGGDYITGDIMHGLDIGKLHAEEIKRYYAKLDRDLNGRGVVLDCNDFGTTDKQVEYDFLHKIVESRVEEIISLLHAYIEPALSRYGAEKILLAGGSSLLPSIGEWTEKIFARPVTLVRPSGLAAEYSHPANTAGYGLVQYAARLASGEHAGGPVRSFFKKLKQLL
ncbi:cell division protein FtsA [Anaeroselena agilis]|uniref:Cell division protein FtsA n=1 Tax=Anaeroselena agilis TaxID=3063788 RepID=A0ABU3P0R2_9FIRM|nr:cell division protein FtsA [Selenomonadales bacterium 4137-cl]